MANIDIPIKRLMQSRVEDWVEYLMPNCEKDWIIALENEKIPAKNESRLDKLILIDAPEGRCILNIEPQGYFDSKMSARMLRYKSDIWEYTMEKGMGTPSIKQAVIYFFKEHDNKKYSLEDHWDEEETLKYSYKAIKVWEMRKEEIIKKKLLGLYPLIPLMKKGPKETDENVLEETILTISSVEDTALQADLFAVTSILAGEKFSKGFVKKYIRRNMLMKSSLFNEWVEEERKEATEKAEKDTTKRNILDLLSEKFDFVPNEVRESINTINDIGILDGLHKKIIKINTLEDFKVLLEKAKNLK